jgi:hypothetical protein
MACGLRGTKIGGAAYRQGSGLNGDARNYQFRAGLLEADANSGHLTIREPPVCALVRRRLRDILKPDEIDLLYLRFSAGWSQAAVARKLGCFRSTIKRREERILQLVRADRLLREAAGC